MFIFSTPTNVLLLLVVDMPVKVPEFQVDRPQVPLGSGAASKAFFIDEIMHQIIESVKIGDKAVWRALALTHSSITADAQSRLVQFLVLETAKQWLRLIDMLRNNSKFRPWIKDLTFRTYGTGYDIMLLPVTPGFTAMIEELFPALHTVSVDRKVILDKNFVFRLPALRNLYVHYRAFWNVSWVDHETEYPLQGEDKDSLAPLQLDFLCLDMYSHEDRGAPRSGAKCCIDLDGWLTTSGALRNVRSIKFFLHVMRDFCELAYVLAECTKLEEIEFNGVYGRNTWKERREDNPQPFPYHRQYSTYSPSDDLVLTYTDAEMALRSKTLRSITYEAGHQSDCMVALADLFNGSALPAFRQLNLVTFDPNHQPIPSFEPEIMREFLERRTGRENAVQRLDDKLMAQMELIDLRFVCGPMPDIEIFLENFGPANRPEVLKVTWNEPAQAHDTNRVWTS
jgi:hypothetical protein